MRTTPGTNRTNRFRAARALGCAALALAAASCANNARFALRPPLVHDSDMEPLSHRPATRRPLDVTTGIDETVLRPLSEAFTFPYRRPARNVNALDEVPDSSWYTNRTPTPAESATGACADVPPPQAPFEIRSSKSEGATPGFNVVDAHGRHYVIKFSQHPNWQPEINQVADAVGSRLYWTLGYNTPCNRVVNVTLDDLRITPRSVHEDAAGHHAPLTADQLRELFGRTGAGPDGRARATLSLFVEGEPIGPWAPTGVRDDDPNDVIAHEDRRELRGERLLAAWTDHWDARSPNTLDTFVHATGGGFVRHWMLDFGDLFGVLEVADARSRRLGHTSIFHPGRIAVDFFGLGLVQRPWDSQTIDPRYVDLGYYSVDHFDPEAWEPLIPSTRYGAATPQDLGWMARKIARVTPEHLRAMIATGELTHPAVADRLLEVMLGRRARLLRWAFDHTSSLGEAHVVGEQFCAVDLAILTGTATESATSYTTTYRTGDDLGAVRMTPALAHGARAGEYCFRLPPHFAPADAREDAPARYATLDIVRNEGSRHNTLRAHFYDLGPERGYALVGIER